MGIKLRGNSWEKWLGKTLARVDNPALAFWKWSLAGAPVHRLVQQAQVGISVRQGTERDFKSESDSFMSLLCDFREII